MKRPIQHTAIITFERARCQCGAWPGLVRQAEETIGAFTVRAHLAHERHAAERHARDTEQKQFFGQQDELFSE